MLLEPSVLGIRQAYVVKAGAAAREDTPGRGAGGETHVFLLSPPSSLFSVPSIGTGVRGMKPSGSSCCDIEGKDVG